MKSAERPPEPLLRRLRVEALRRERESLVGLHDPLGVAETDEGGRIVIPAEIWEIARCFDGQGSAAEIAHRLTRAGRPLRAEDVERVAQGFSQRRLLQDASFESAARARLAEARALGLRRARGAGREYEAQRFELRVRLAGMVADDWDMPAPPETLAAFAPAGPLDRLGRLYARTWAALRWWGRHFQRVVLLSSAEHPLEQLLVPTALPFETPLGRSEIDREALAALALEPGLDELAHLEHMGLERHALFLQLFAAQAPIVPLLVSALPARLPDGQSAPRGLPEVERALEALARLDALPGPTLWLCSFDLAVLGAEAREGLEPTLAGAARLRELDRASMDAARALDADGFWRAGLGWPDARRAGALSAPYLLLRRLAERPSADALPLIGEVAGYLQSSQPGSLMAAVSALFHREGPAPLPRDGDAAQE